MGPRASFEEHAPLCEFRTVECAHGCESVLRLSDVGEHNCIKALKEELRETKARLASVEKVNNEMKDTVL